MDRGFLFNIHIYLFWGGWEDFNTLQCSCEAVHPDGPGLQSDCSAYCDKLQFTQVPPSLTSHPGAQVELLSGPQDNKIVRANKHNKFS